MSTKPSVEVLDERFLACVSRDSPVTRLWSGSIWAEGPAWFSAGSYLLWSDIPNNRMMRWNEAGGSISVFREPSNGANGNTVDREGRLITCEQFARRVTRTEPDGSITILSDRFGGKRFNSPNDVVVKSDGSIWFSDPTYGLGHPAYEGEPEIGGCHVYRLDPNTAAVTQMTSDFVMPNGLAFSPDEGTFYVIDTGGTHVPNGPFHVRRFSVTADQRLMGGEVFAVSTAGSFDGLRIDTAGRLWCSAADGVHCYDPDGTLIGKVLVPEIVGNLTFGGRDGYLLLICGTTSLYCARVRIDGAQRRRER
jgi:gluconolactonase